MKQLLLLTLLALLPVTAPVSASDNSADVATLSAYLKKLDSFEANFTQQVITNTAVEFDKTEGKFSLKRPNQFRWQIDTPYEQTIVADGENIYSVDHDLAQVTIAMVVQHCFKISVDRFELTPGIRPYARCQLLLDCIQSEVIQ